MRFHNCNAKKKVLLNANIIKFYLDMGTNSKCLVCYDVKDAAEAMLMLDLNGYKWVSSGSMKNYTPDKLPFTLYLDARKTVSLEGIIRKEHDSIYDIFAKADIICAKCRMRTEYLYFLNTTHKRCIWRHSVFYD